MSLNFTSCTYKYKRWYRPVLDDFNYVLQDGLTVLLGPNGAGKSTILKLGAGVIHPHIGAVTLDSIRSTAAIYRRNVAWLPQTVIPMPGLTAREYVAYIGWLKGMSRRESWDRAAQALGRVNLGAESNNKTTRLSGGQLRRVGVAGALVHDARVILLDEPTAGMDPHQRRIFRDVVGSLIEDVKILISTHDVVDLVEEAQHVTVVNGGRILHTGSTAEFLDKTPEGTVLGRAAEGAYSEILQEADLSR